MAGISLSTGRLISLLSAALVALAVALWPATSQLAIGAEYPEWITWAVSSESPEQMISAIGPELPAEAMVAAEQREEAAEALPQDGETSNLALAGPPEASILDRFTDLAPNGRLTSINGSFLLLNMHGALFHSKLSEVEEQVAYAQWMGAGAIRVFATDNNSLKGWSGEQVGNRIADVAPALRAANVKLIVALVNNHRPNPDETADSYGWMDGYYQLLLTFYTENWRDSYLQFVRELIGTVQRRGALDVIYGWELGNELHTPRDPAAIVSFVTESVQEIRQIDPNTPVLPGTMGVHHLEAYRPDSPVGRWLYCEAPIDAYTLHSYDWLSPEEPGDMPINYDLDQLLIRPCPSGRRLPVIVEELGTSRELPGRYRADQEEKRLELELKQIRYVLDHRPLVIGIGAWNGESPRSTEHTFYDNRRGLTSYGPAADGSGSGYVGENGIRFRLEQALRSLPMRP